MSVNANVCRLVELSATLWAGEAEVVRTYWDSSVRTGETDLRWLRLLNVGGLACFHDYSPKFKGVQWPVDRFLKRNGHFSRQGLAGSLLCIRRDAESSRAEVTGSDRVWALWWAVFFQLGASVSKRTTRLKRARK